MFIFLLVFISIFFMRCPSCTSCGILNQAHVFYTIYKKCLLYESLWLSSSQVMSGHKCRQFFSRCVKNWLVSPVSNILVAPKPLTAIQQSISTETLKSHYQQVWEVRINHHADIRRLCLDSFDTLNLRYGWIFQNKSEKHIQKTEIRPYIVCISLHPQFKVYKQPDAT